MSTLHITNGDCAAGTLRSFLTDPVLVTCDVLHDGPAPLVDGDAWHDLRARWLAGAYEAQYEETRKELAAFDRRITEPERHDEIVLWFEHDLFDQLLLIRTLDLLGRSKNRDQVSMICIGEFPGVDRFIGLGQLNAAQLASLYPHRKRLTADEYALARDAWQAFRADHPGGLHTLMVRLQTSFDRLRTALSAVEGADPTYQEVRNASDNGALPFLHGAIHRLFEEYPSTTNGLSRSAHAILRVLESGALDAGVLFPATQAEEPRPFMGDSGHFDLVRQLAGSRVPLVTIAPPSLNDSDGPGVLDLRGHSVSITDAGRRVLAGRADAVDLNGIDEWRGGVHLAGVDRSPWRWDPDRERLVS